MANPTSIMENAVEYIRATVIPLVNGSNYHNTVQRVTRTFLVPDELSNDEYPCVCIITDGTATYTPLTASQYTVGASQTDVSDGFPIMLIAYCALPAGDDETDAGELNTRMNFLHADLVKAMHIDTTLGNIVISCTLTDSAHSIVFTADKKIGTVIQSYALKYDFEPSNAVSTS